MFKYILKRILIFIPTLLVISFAVFGLSKIAPGDPVELILQGQQSDAGRATEFLAGEKQYFEVARDLGLDLPSFYFSVNSKAYPDTLYKVGRKNEREMISKLCGQYGNPKEVLNYFDALKDLEYQAILIKREESNYTTKRTISETLNELYREYNDKNIITRLGNIKDVAAKDATFSGFIPKINQVIKDYQSIKINKNTLNKFIPKISWYGSKNQYHRWLLGDIPWFKKNDDPTLMSYGMLRGDFGKSTQDGRPVWSVLKDGLKITIWLNLIAVIIIYAVAIPLGVYIAVKKDSLFDRASTIILFILYSLPTFWIATMLIVFFTNSEYGMNWFPSNGLGDIDINSSTGFLEKIWIRTKHAFLPIACMVYGGFAFLSRQMRGGVLDVFNQDYIRTARAKGLPENKIIWKHTFRNSLIPLITMFASILPGMIGGSVVLEVIFGIPGMGNIAFGSIIARNWPVLFTVVMFSSALSLVGILLSDILYSVVDPRITFTKK